ncbi:MAG: helix-turn-helix transcriptional regulator [Rhodanobacter sp.]
MSLATRIRQSLDAIGMSQAELARRCNVKPPSVSGWLSGKSKFLRGENLLRAADALDVSNQWLATGKGSKIRTANMVNDQRPEYMVGAPIDPDIVLHVAQALHNVFDELGLAYDFTAHPQIFITAYQNAHTYGNYRGGSGNAWLGSQITQVLSQGVSKDGPATDTHAGSVHKERTRGATKKS